MTFKIQKLPLIFQFIVFITFIEVLFFSILYNVGFGFFSLVPYLRLISVFFVFVFLLNKKLLTTSFLRINLLNKTENTLVLIWFLYGIISLIIGIIKFNPIIYLVTDFAYIFIGFVLFRTFQSEKFRIEKNNFILDKRQNYYLFSLCITICLLSYFLGAELPSFFVVFSVSYSLFLYYSKERMLSLLFLTPFVFQILKANRSMLVVFAVVLVLAFLKDRLTKKNILFIFIILSMLLSILFFFSEEILKYLMTNVDSFVLKMRIQQLYLIASGKINWNAPNALSLKQRYDEVLLVIKYCFSNPFNFLFGSGSGGTIEGFAFKDAGVTGGSVVGKEAIHNIHILPFSLFFRYGFFGILIFIYIVKLCFKSFSYILFEKLNYKTLLYIFIVLWVVYSLPAASFLWTCAFFWVFLGFLSKNDLFGKDIKI